MKVDVIAQMVRSNALPGAMAFDLETDLLENGVLDSLGVMGLIADLDQQFGCCISPRFVLPENFRTVASILRIAESSMRESHDSTNQRSTN